MAVSTEIRFGHRIESWVFNRLMDHFARMPFDKASDAGANWLRALGPLVPPHQTALKNLRLAYPNESESWRQDLAVAHWAQLGRVMAEFPHLPEITFQPGDRAELVGGDILDRVKASGKGAVFISGHFATFEIMPVAIVRRGVTCRMTYRPANNPLIDARILTIRQQYGADLQAAKGKEGGMGLLRALAKGDSVALMNDQKYNEGVAAPLFGHDAMTADGPTRLALRFDVPLIPMSVLRVNNTHFRVTVHEPIPLQRDIPPDDAVRDSVIRINQFVEARVREAPEQWFWVHKRWPKEAWNEQ